MFARVSTAFRQAARLAHSWIPFIELRYPSVFGAEAFVQGLVDKYTLRAVHLVLRFHCMMCRPLSRLQPMCRTLRQLNLQECPMLVDGDLEGLRGMQLTHLLLPPYATHKDTFLEPLCGMPLQELDAQGQVEPSFNPRVYLSVLQGCI
jgi:hypothetical protein